MERKRSAVSSLVTGPKGILINTIFFLLLSTAAWAASPVIFYSDLFAGLAKSTNTSNGNGAYVTIWGNNFGSTQGTSTITVGGGAVAQVMSWSNTEICFQLGSSSLTGNIVVTASNGTSNGLAFAITTVGHIYFVQPGASTNGSGSYNSPYSHIWYAYQTSVPGDTIYILSGTIENEANGWNGYHAIVSGDDGEPQGTAANPIAFIAYPGATVNMIATGATATWTDGASGGTDSMQYVFRDIPYSIQSKLVIEDLNGGNAAIGGTMTNGRMVGNTVTTTNNSYGVFDITANNWHVLGNEFKNSYNSTPNNEVHSVYIDSTNSNFEVGWNYFHDNYNQGWEISSYHNGPRSGTIHDNLLISNSSSGYEKGMLIDGCYESGDTASTVETNTVYVYNNVLINEGQYEDGGAIQANCGTNYIYNNTIYGSGAEIEGIIQFETGGMGPGGGNPVEYVANNIIYSTDSSELYYSDSNGNAPTWSQISQLTNNNYYGAGNGPSEDAKAVNANPQFASPSLAIGGNFQLQSTSPDINTGYNTISVVLQDIAGLVRSTTPSIGAYQYSSSSSTPVPVVSITSPTSGSSVTSGSNVSITAAASETNGTISNIAIYNGSTLLGSSSSSPYTYVMSDPAVGTYTLTAVATDANGVSTTSSAVTVTVASQSQASSPVVTITSPASASSYTAGSNVTVTTTASETNGTISNIYLYNGSGLLLGSSTSSPFNFVDTNMAAGGYSFYAVATDANGVSTTSSTVTVMINAPAVPVVTIISPANASSYSFSSNITLTASASETNGSISTVAFYNGSTLIGSSSSSPYSITWNSVAAGSYSLTAVATDANGASTTSNAVSITVTGSTTPVVALTSPSTGSSFSAGSNITINASASVGSGSISKVVFYNGSTILATVTSSPYSYTWSNMAAGNYSLTAKAYNGSKKSATSTAVTVSVTGLPAVSLSANNTTFTAPALITLTAAASETNGTISKVEFFNGSTLLGTDTSSPYTYTWSNVAAGSYTLTAEAFDNNNNTVTSSAINVTVTLAGVAPSFTTQPMGATVTAPAVANFSVAATGTPAPTFQWMQSVNGGAFSNISGATSSSYTTAATSTANSGTQFECVITNASGSVTSNIATLTVNPAPAAPSFTAQPVSATVTAPAVANFSVAATGTPAPTFQWMQSVNGGAFSNISGATSSSYTTAATSTANSGTQFECVITNASGSVTSNIATLTVNPAPVAVSITAQPVSVTVTSPAVANFSVAATGTPAPTFQWMQSVNGGAFSNISGATSSTYTTSATTVANSGTKFECVVTNASGSVTSNAATLTVNPAPVAPSFTAQPASATVTAPAVANFSVAATGTPAPTFQWMQSVNGGAFSNIAGATSSSYTTAATTVANSGTQFECVITNASGSVTSNIAALTVNAAPVTPSFTTQPVSATVTAPAVASFSVAATGTPAPTFQWMQSVNGGAFSAISGATSSSYTTTATTVANSGTQFECVITNASGSVTSNIAALTVNAAPVPSTPTITLTSPTASSSFTAPATIFLSANASEANGTITQVQFFNGSIPLYTANSAPYSYTWTSNLLLGSYTITAQATDSRGVVVTSTPATITIGLPTRLGTGALTPTVAITSPASGSNITAGSSLTITANASETNGKIAVVYFYNGSAFLGSSNASPYNFTWNNVPAGTYSLTAKAVDADGGSAISSPVTVTAPSSAPAAPSVAIINPANGNTFTTGTNVTIMANASETPGTGSYALAVAAITQVQFYNGSTLLGTSTTSPYSYNWSNVPAGTYSLIAKATDTNGVSTSSSPVTVIVTTPSLPVVSLTNPANGGSYATGSSISISANASEVNGTIAQVQFYNGSTLLGTDTTSPYTYTLTNAQVGGYTLTAKATDINGVSVTSSPVSFDVTAVPPTVAITSPANASSLTAGSTMNITANASEVNGTIAQVQFYNGSTLLGTSTTSPYTLSLTNVPAGTYTLTAQATDVNGISTSSSTVTVTVAAPAPVVPVTPVTPVAPVAPTTPSLPTVTLSGLTSGSTVMLGTTIPLSVNASEANGAIAQVQIYSGSTLIYYSNSSSFNFNWRANMLLGTYNLTAQVTDANGAVVTSAPIKINIAL